ncbi:hypothetical protein AKJ65_06745 [candidate division MSBL1 archaeon SCGC-AAA259E19]|uniref:Uncharacterized protein n=1 Tax=candidate division MSBL1 archaeon SCGC-AAA259E19 TaxID=1698264 RepID=A0A133UFQ8_9EURY|nr:hypothetical protein AKJ65_06745 [candidate division MSBL1 archaeon SCGC-AAA259E19]
MSGLGTVSLDESCRLNRHRPGPRPRWARKRIKWMKQKIILVRAPLLIGGDAMEKDEVTEELAAEVKHYWENEGLEVRSISEIMEISMQDVTKIINSDVYKKVVTRPADRSRPEARPSTGNKDLVPFEEVITADPMEFEIEGRGKYWVHEIYCEDPECSCPGAKLVFFKSDEGGKVFTGGFSMDNFEFVSESMRSVVSRERMDRSRKRVQLDENSAKSRESTPSLSQPDQTITSPSLVIPENPQQQLTNSFSR